jgi:hypothetical protein
VLGSQLLALIDLFVKSRPAVGTLPGMRRIAQLAQRAAN